MQFLGNGGEPESDVLEARPKGALKDIEVLLGADRRA